MELVIAWVVSASNCGPRHGTTTLCSDYHANNLVHLWYEAHVPQRIIAGLSCFPASPVHVRVCCCRHPFHRCVDNFETGAEPPSTNGIEHPSNSNEPFWYRYGYRYSNKLKYNELSEKTRNGIELDKEKFEELATREAQIECILKNMISKVCQPRSVSCPWLRK